MRKKGEELVLNVGCGNQKVGLLRTHMSYGELLVRQPRNPYDLWRDLDAERLRWQPTARLVEQLRSSDIEASNCREAVSQIIDELTNVVKQGAFGIRTEQIKAFPEDCIGWIRAFESLD